MGAQISDFIVQGYFHHPAPASNLKPDFTQSFGDLSKLESIREQPGGSMPLHKDGAEAKDMAEGNDWADDKDQVNQEEPADLSRLNPGFIEQVGKVKTAWVGLDRHCVVVMMLHPGAFAYNSVYQRCLHKLFMCQELLVFLAKQFESS